MERIADNTEGTDMGVEMGERGVVAGVKGFLRVGEICDLMGISRKTFFRRRKVAGDPVALLKVVAGKPLRAHVDEVRWMIERERREAC